MNILDPVPEEMPDPDCPKCHGEGVPQSQAHKFLADDCSKTACPKCHKEKDDERAGEKPTT